MLQRNLATEEKAGAGAQHHLLHGKPFRDMSQGIPALGQAGIKIAGNQFRDGFHLLPCLPGKLGACYQGTDHGHRQSRQHNGQNDKGNSTIDQACKPASYHHNGVTPATQTQDRFGLIPLSAKCLFLTG